MLELLAAWTDLTITWSMEIEWLSRRDTELNEHFYEGGPVRLGEPHRGRTVIKLLNPEVDIEVTRAILMIRDPLDVHRSAFKLGQRIWPEDVQERITQFRNKFTGHLDEVEFEELRDPPRLFRRLGEAGWPVTVPSYLMQTRAIR